MFVKTLRAAFRRAGTMLATGSTPAVAAEATGANVEPVTPFDVNADLSDAGLEPGDDDATWGMTEAAWRLLGDS